MSKSFFWYDLETSGTEPRWDRIVQIAGMRTDEQLKPVGDEFTTYVHLPDDVLPNPAATLVTGITPQIANTRGIGEWQAVRQLHDILTVPGTCTVGYNSLRFDDEFVRFAFYRNMFDPYSREWRDGNSRWDIVDLVRAAGALRRDGLEWPVDDDDLPVYRLEVLTRANGIEHDSAHDAMSDVRATLGMAQRLLQAQPKLFHYYLQCRFKNHVRQLLEPFAARLCVHVSGMYPRTRFCAAPVVSLCRHPVNTNAIVVVDLSQDISMLLDAGADDIRDALFTAGSESRPPLKEVRVNKCPFVADFSVVTDGNRERLGFDDAVIQRRWRKLRKPGLAQKIMQVYRRPDQPAAVDPDAALYDAFVKDADRNRCASLVSNLSEGRWQPMDFDDVRMRTLQQRLKVRAFPEQLSESERADWHDFVRGKLFASDAEAGGWRTLEQFRQELAELADADANSGLLAALTEHAGAIESKYA